MRIVTETDIIRRVVGAGKVPSFVKTGSIMSSPLVAVPEQGLVIDVAEMMHGHCTRHVTVMEEGSNIRGLVSVRDLHAWNTTQR